MHLQPCPHFEPVRAIGRVNAPELREISGVVQSLLHEDVLYVHNDSGDEERVYAISTAGKLLAKLRVGEEGRAFDVEDISIARENGRPLIYVGDIGDNRGRRSSGIRIDRFEEPEQLPGVLRPHATVNETRIVDFQTITLHYPEGPQNSEALLVDPLSGAIVLISKVFGGWARIYERTQFSSGALSLVGELHPEIVGDALQYVTAADVSRDGRFIGVRTYSYAYLFRRKPGQSLAASLLSPACPVPTANEVQGEALALLSPADGQVPTFLTISEGREPEVFVTPGRPPH